MLAVRLLSRCNAFVVVLLALGACRAEPVQHPSSALSTQTANLHAFARLYGVVRWFHPSDAASAIDWDQFAVDGARRVVNAPDSKALRATLVDLFGPIAPTVRIVSGDETLAPDIATRRPPSKGVEIVAWEHKGYGDSTYIGPYASKRRHRARVVAEQGAPFAILSQVVEATPFHGKRLRIRGKIRTANHGQGRLWMRVDRGDQRAFFDNMRDRPISNTSWVNAEIVGTVAGDATRIVFGTVMSGGGTVWYDDIELATEVGDGQWAPVVIKDPGFESAELASGWSPGAGNAAGASMAGWLASIDHVKPATGNASLKVEAATKLATDELFDDAPEPDEAVDLELSRGLRARVPLSLYSIDGRTLGDDPAIAKRSQEAAHQPQPVHFDVIWGVADVIVLWNVLEHFWPYWNVVTVDWNAELDQALSHALTDRNPDDHMTTLRRLSAAAPDGHAETTCPSETRRITPPFEVDVVEGQVVVTSTSDSGLMVGDVITSIAGRPAGEQLAADVQLESGSPQWRIVRARARFGSGPVGSSVRLSVRRGDKDVSMTITLTGASTPEPTRLQFERFADGVVYVDLGRATIDEINANMSTLATAPGVVFDLRDHPNGNHDVLSYLLTGPVDITKGFATPHVVRPDHVASSVTAWEESSTILPALQPHIGGRVAFVTGPAARSYAESVMMLVEHSHLGAIVGMPTAGTDGNVAEVSEPTGCRTLFTGMRVTKGDGTGIHLVGVQPTIRASQTIAGVVAGRDEVLERALAYVRGQAK